MVLIKHEERVFQYSINSLLLVPCKDANANTMDEIIIILYGMLPQFVYCKQCVYVCKTS